MRRLASFLVRNWPLKIGAVALATVLYGGVVLSENTREWPGPVPIDILDPPPDAAVLTVLEPVTRIQYRAPLDVASRLTNGSFHATVDLSGIVPRADGAPVNATVQLFAIDDSVDIVDYFPKDVQILLDPIAQRQIAVSVDHGTVPGGLRLGPAVVDPPTIEVEGAGTRVASVRSATARVSIDASGINVDQQVEVLALDETGDIVPGVELTPDRVRVRIEVARQLTFATLPVIPEVVGEVASGYSLGSVTVEPLSVFVSGEESAVERLTAVRTEPIDISGRTGSLEVDAPLAPPEEITVNGSTTVRVTIAIRPAEGSRTFESGLVLEGESDALVYGVALGSVLVTLAGPIPVLDSIAVADIPAILDVAGLEPGRSTVPVQVAPPDGTDVLSISPASVTVDVTEPVPSPTVPGASGDPADDPTQEP